MRSQRAPSPLLVIFLIVFFDLVSFGIIIPILPYYAKEFGADAFAWSWVMAIFSIAQFIFAPVWGGMSDVYGRRPILLGSIFLGALAAVALAFANSIEWIFICRLLAGIFAANISTATAYIADSTTPENRARGMGIIGAGFGLGFIFGPAIGGLLAPHGLHVPILVAAGLGLLNFTLAFVILKEPLANLEERRGNRRRYDLNLVRETLAASATRTPALIFFLSTFAFTQLEVSFGFFVLDRFGYGPREAGSLLALMGIIMVLIQGGLIGRLAKRFGEVKLVRFALPLMGLALVGAALATAIWPFALCLVAIAAANALVNPSLSSLMSQAAPPERMGGMMGVYQSASALGRIVGPPVAGWLYVSLGLVSPLYAAALVFGLAWVMASAYRMKRAT